ncbi:P-type DNA transfer ATPase VirB11 [Photobacterium phosphoreum]|uniref:Type IV secretion system protein n=1 Tax=Photobacterium phosphoreum TaxID=659 RepID=A0AAW4ZQE2_PHOPO|nr:P-type DNA transfer ATPase VirB11 [Photobacterium phosphoreum]MCD9492620.1 P-type DNA transfer ATPase VirB11 [Photobacterium phosphoreum]MCF2191815.1 P-type DNA transfer ATPase VirB11 [Photobacterium phosphoreum]MCF2303452.1 P-type DNA transfer ATPase VirB11 [Photobacterium phosphoreum]
MIDGAITVKNLLILTGIQDVLNLDGITEVAVNQPHRIWYEKGNGWEYKDAPQCSYQHCLSLARALAVFSGLRSPLDFNNPIASVTLPDGERGQILIAPACETGTIAITIRKPSIRRFTLEDYEQSGRFNTVKEATKKTIELSDSQNELLLLKKQKRIIEFFQLAIKLKLNILIVGGTGSGKTSFMKPLVDCYPHDKRLITIEDTPECDLPYHLNHIRLFYKEGGITPKVIIEACMRLKPDHIFLAELRGDEAWNYIEMLNTGHAGSITTIHANDCYSAFSRLASLVKQSNIGQTLDYDFIMKTIKSSIDVVCFYDHTYLTEIYYNPQEKNQLLSE